VIRVTDAISIDDSEIERPAHYLVSQAV